MEFSLLVLLLIGLLAGVLAGLLGIGGGVLFTPVLFLLFKGAGIAEPVVWTIGSSLFCTFIASAGSSIRQFGQQNIYWADGLGVGVLGAAGVWAGKLITTASFYTEKVFAVLFSLLFCYVAYMFFRKGSDKSAEEEGQPGNSLTRGRVVITGGAGGFVAALAGIGGGSVMVPVMNLYYRLPFRKAVSISSLAIVLISLSGWLQFGFYAPSGPSLSGLSMGVVDIGTALPLSAGGLAGGFLGALVNLRIDRRYLQYAFSLLALVIVLKLLTDVF